MTGDVAAVVCGVGEAVTVPVDIGHPDGPVEIDAAAAIVAYADLGPRTRRKVIEALSARAASSDVSGAALRAVLGDVDVGDRAAVAAAVERLAALHGAGSVDLHDLL